MRFKHNKKRNTALLYEYLIKELTKTIVESNENKKESIVSIIKEFFAQDTELSKELSIYKSISECSNVSAAVAEKILLEAKRQFDSLDKNKIFESQSRLIRIMNQAVSKDVYSNFVPHYKDLATIYQMFNAEAAPKQKVLLEQKVLTLMAEDVEERKLSLPEYDNLVYKKFTEKFNQVYSDSLLNEQKELLSKYITSFDENNLEFKIYLNEEISRIKSILQDFEKTKEFIEDEPVQQKIGKVYEAIAKISEKRVDLSTIDSVLKLQDITYEILN